MNQPIQISSIRRRETHPVLVVTALRDEFLAVRRALGATWEVVHPKGTVYSRGTRQGQYCDWEVSIVEIGQGNQQAAVGVERGSQFSQPMFAFFVGVAGGIKDVALGDVVVADKVYAYESGKSRNEFHPRPDLYQANYRLLERAKSVARSGVWPRSREFREGTPNVKVGPIAAGEQVVGSTLSGTYSLVTKNYGDAVAFDMESHGHMLAAHANELPALIIRGISDLLDGKEESDKQGWQERAAQHAASFMFSVLDGLEPLPREEASPPISWEHVQRTINALHHKIETAFRPDVILTMSGPGSVTALYMMTIDQRSTPLLIAVTFPRNVPAEESMSYFADPALKADWMYVQTEKWDVFVPNVVRTLPKNSRILLFDDRIVSGETQKRVRQFLSAELGLDVRTAAVFAPPGSAELVDFLGEQRSGTYLMPWGPDNGRYIATVAR